MATTSSSISLIVRFSKNAGIGFDVSKFEMDYWKRIAYLAREGALVMGRITWDSLSEGVCEVLTSSHHRRVFVITTKAASAYAGQGVCFVHPSDLDTHLTRYTDVFVLGGESIYAMFINRAQRIFVSVEDAAPVIYENVRFPLAKLQQFQITQHSDAKHFMYERVTQVKHRHGEYAYLDLLSDIYNTGRIREDRTRVGTVAVFGRQMRFNIENSVPLLTTKQLGWKSVVRELLWFLHGKTDSKLLEQHKVNIWKDNTTREFLDKRGLSDYKEGDIGPMYGFQWRHMGAEYHGADADYKRPAWQGYDQIAWLLNSIRTDPYSRRHMITTYNPVVVDKGVLAPCHGIVCQFFVEDAVEGGQRSLSCHVYNRSQDTFLGMSWNIFSYAVLTYIIAKFTNTHPKELVISTGDTHIYSNHLEQTLEQLKRPPLPFPVLKLHERINGMRSIDELTIDDFELIGYISHPPLRAPMAV